MDYRKIIRPGMAVTALLLACTQASASHINGIRITPTGDTALNPMQIEGLDVEVDVTAFYTTGSTNSTAYLGTYYNVIPAIDWGDGNSEARYGVGPSTGIPLVATSTVVNGVPARAYRGSFSHTYAASGDYTIAANTRCCPVTTPTYTLVSGDIVTTTVSTTGVFGPTTFTTSFVQNLFNVFVGWVAPEPAPPPEPPKPVPMLGGGGIILLAGFSALAGLLYSRRKRAQKS